MAIAEESKVVERHGLGRAWYVAAVLLGPFVAVGLFLLGIAMLSGIPPAPAPKRPLWADLIIAILLLGFPFAVGVVVSARGVAGLRRMSGWATAGLAIVVVVLGSTLIALALWQLGWPVLVTGTTTS